MAEEGLKINIGADVSEANNAIKILTAQFARLQKLASLPDLSFKQQERLNSLLAKTSKELAFASKQAESVGKGLNNAKPGINQAANALQNLGRVAQDAPFGFIGIQNNLNPLLESFQRLKAETGSTGGALKALASSMLGAGGIGFALSAASALLLIFGDGLFKSSKATDDAKQANEDFKKSIKDIGDIQSEAVSSVQGQIATVNSLAAVVSDANKPYQERKRALEELKEINKSYFGDLDLESAKLGILKKRVDEYTNAIVNEAITKKFSAAIADTADALSKQQKVVDRARQALTNAHKEEEAWFIAQGKSASEATGVTADQVAASKVLAEENKKLTELSFQNIDQHHELDKAVKEGLKSRDLESKTTKQTAEHVKKIREETERTMKMLGTPQGIKSFALPEVDAAFQGKGKIVPSIDFTPAIQSIIAGRQQVEKLLGDFNSSLQGRLADMAGTLAGGLAEAIGQAIGGEGLKSALSGFLTLVGGALENIGKAAVELGVQILVLKRAMTFAFANPGLLIALGAAAIAAGAIIKSRIPKFAEGGIATKPTLGIFGEAGPEALIPLNKMNGMGGPILVQAEFRIRGKDLVAVANTGQRSLNRTT